MSCQQWSMMFCPAYNAYMIDDAIEWNEWQAQSKLKWLEKKVV